MSRTPAALRFELDYWGAALEDIQTLNTGAKKVSETLGASVALHLALLLPLIKAGDLEALDTLQTSLVALREAHRVLVEMGEAVGNLVDLTTGRQEVIQQEIDAAAAG